MRSPRATFKYSYVCMYIHTSNDMAYDVIRCSYVRTYDMYANKGLPYHMYAYPGLIDNYGTIYGIRRARNKRIRVVSTSCSWDFTTDNVFGQLGSSRTGVYDGIPLGR